jgi:hypothetical protein
MDDNRDVIYTKMASTSKNGAKMGQQLMEIRWGNFAVGHNQQYDLFGFV